MEIIVNFAITIYFLSHYTAIIAEFNVPIMLIILTIKLTISMNSSPYLKI